MYVNSPLTVTDLSNEPIYVSAQGVLTVTHNLTNINGLNAEDGGVIDVCNDLVNVRNIGVGFGSTLSVDHSMNGASATLGGIGSGTLNVGNEFSIVADSGGSVVASQTLDGNGDSAVTINSPSYATSKSKLTVDVTSPNLQIITPTLNLNNSDIQNTAINIGFDVELNATIFSDQGSLVVNAASPHASRLNLVGTSYIRGASADFEAPVDGTGTLVVGATLGKDGLPIDGSALFDQKYPFGVGSGLTVDLEGGGNHAAMGGGSITLDSSFGGTIRFLEGSADYIDVKNVTADSYTYKNNVLSLYHGNQAVYSLNVVNSSGFGTHPFPLTVERNAAGILISTNDVNQAGGIGTALPVYSPTPPPPPPPPKNPPCFLVNDDSGTWQSQGQTYNGPVSGLTDEIILANSSNVNITAEIPNVFIKSGSGEDALDVSAVNGNNVLDGSTGSNFLTGGTGDDTFFVDDRGPAANIWSTVNGFHAGDSATVFGVTQHDFTLNWLDGQGAAGYTGLTLNASAVGKPTAALTLAGYTAADMSSGILVVSFGTETDGTSYMLVKGH